MDDSADTADLDFDYRLLRYLAGDLTRKLSRIRKPSPVISAAVSLASEEAADINASCSRKPDRGMKYSFFMRIRQLYAVVSSLTTADAWQSPSFTHTAGPQHGELQGNISAHSNDYTRDQHAGGNAYAASFLGAYVNGRFPMPVYGYATTSGMAAYAVAALFVRKRIGQGIALMGSSVYFENKDVLHELFGDRLVEVDDTDDVKLCAEIRRLRPDAVFIDTLANHPSMAMPDTGGIIHSLKRGAYCVFDNSALSLGCSPLFPLAVRSGRVRLLVTESLNKFHQFGMDRVTGGIVWGTGSESILLYDYRDRFGSNIADASAAALPAPNRSLLASYLGRLGRNAGYLAKFLSSGQDVFSVAYPGLRAGAKPGRFHGAYIVLNRKSGKPSQKYLESYVRRVFRTASKRGIPLVGGTSFGLPVTRVYVVGARGTYASPFLRIAPGTETASEIRALGRVLMDAI